MENKMTNEAKLINKTDFQYTYMINGTSVTIEKINKKWEGFESQKIVLSPPSKYLGEFIYTPEAPSQKNIVKKTKKEVLEFYIWLLNDEMEA